MEEKTIAQLFSNMIVEAKYDNFDAETLESAKYRLLDLLGNMIASKVSDSFKMAVATAEELGGEGVCTIIGSNKKVTAMNAVLANSMNAYSFDFVDDHNDSCAHPSPATIPTALVLAEEYNLTGKELMEAWMVGNEVIARAGSAYLGNMPKQCFHPTAVLGTMGSAAVAAKAMKLTKEQTTSAQGLAISAMAAGTYGWNTVANHAKRVIAGQAARNGILAATLAKNGVVGPPDAYEGQFGAFNAFSYQQQWDSTQAVRNIGKEWQFACSSIKPYPACRYSGGTIDACRDLLSKHKINTDEIRRVVYATQQPQIKNCLLPLERRKNPENMVEMQHSFPYCGAVGLLKGDFTVEDLMPENLKNPKIIDLMQKAEYRVDEELDKRYPEAYSTAVEVEMNDGTWYRGEVYYPLGDWRNPVSNEFIIEKFKSLCRNAITDEGRINEIIDFVMHIEEKESIHPLIAKINFAI